MLDRLMVAIDGMKTSMLVMANMGLGVYMIFNPEYVMPNWMQIMDVALFGGAFRSAMAKQEKRK